MTFEDLAIIEADRGERWLVELIQALVAAEMGSPLYAATGTFDELDAPEGRED